MLIVLCSWCFKFTTLVGHLVKLGAVVVNMNADKAAFNDEMSTIRQESERGFGMLKGRMKWLRCLETSEPDKAALIVTAACVMHNFSIVHGDIAVEEFYDKSARPTPPRDIPTLARDAYGHTKRNRIMAQISARRAAQYEYCLCVL